MIKRLWAAVIFVATFFLAPASWAQNVFIQIEAHASLGAADARVRDFAADLTDVNGFRLSGSWYAIALGPYDLDTAVSQMNSLKRSSAIPADSYLLESSAYREQFYPIGANSLQSAAVTPQEPATPTVQEETAVAEPETPAEPEVAPEPPEETRREALRSERDLSRQEKFNLQIAMQWFGYYQGSIDAAFGPGTRNSMAAWQTDKGYEPTGVLTTRQRAELTGDYEAVLASVGLNTVTDVQAGIEMELPLALVEFEKHDPPFAHYKSKGDDDIKVLLISQKGDESSLLGLYDIMQTLRIVPLEGERNRKKNSFTLTGQDDKIQSYTYAVLDGGEIKGFTLMWPIGDDQRRNLVLKAMRDSFTPISGTVLPDTLGDGDLEQSLDLISGLEIRRPDVSTSGFYINDAGMVLTTTGLTNGCGRVTLDEVYDAEIVAEDAELGLAVLKPQEKLAPLGFARFLPGVPRLQSEIVVAGFSFGGRLGAPTMSFGTLADVRGLNGEETIKRLAVTATDGDAGGPVLSANGAVMGMLLPNDENGGRQLPGDVKFATDAIAIAEFLSNAGYAPAASDQTNTLEPEDLTNIALDLTVLVSCWN